jgi:hypothetical protein
MQTDLRDGSGIGGLVLSSVGTVTMYGLPPARFAFRFSLRSVVPLWFIGFIGNALIFFAANHFDVKCAMGITRKPTGQEAVPRGRANGAADVGARELHSFLCHAVEMGRVGIAPKGGDA